MRSVNFHSIWATGPGLDEKQLLELKRILEGQQRGKRRSAMNDLIGRRLPT